MQKDGLEGGREVVEDKVREAAGSQIMWGFMD